MQIKFTVPAVPVAQPRQRHAIRGKKGGAQFVTNYTPADHPVNTFKAQVAWAAHNVFQGAPLTGPLSVTVLAFFHRPKNMIWKKRLMPREFKTSTPDNDNLEKSVYDALKGVVWHDDSQISINQTWKMICSGDEQPHVCVTITAMDKEYQASMLARIK